MKVKSIKSKVKAKVVAKLAKKGIATKATKAASALLLAAALAAIAGCTTADAPTAAKAQTQELHDIHTSVVIGSYSAPTNINYAALSEEQLKAIFQPLVSIEIGTQGQANEVGDGETTTVTPTQTPTMTIPTRVDARYNDAAKAAGGVLETFLASLAPDSATELKKFVASGKDGSLTVAKTDGTTETVTCKGGVCSDSAGTCLNCSD